MRYVYDITLHNSTPVTIARACILADTIQSFIDENSSVQGVGLGESHNDVKITIQTIFKLDDLFSAILDNRKVLNYKDFSIYYSEGFSKVGQMGYGV